MEKQELRKKKKSQGISVRKFDSGTTKFVYWTFQILILLTLLASIVLAILEKTDLETALTHILLCVTALILFNIPSFLKRRFHIYIPTLLQVFTLLFIYAHFIMGEIQGVYMQNAFFDKILHTTSGLAIATIGFSLVNLLNTSTNTHLKLSPFFVALFSFCFALAAAVLWEIFEYAVDSLLGFNMQRYIPPENVALPTPPKQGYGLIDTMIDIIVSTIAALVVSVLGFISLKTKSNILNRFLLRKLPDYEFALTEAREAGDEKLVLAIEKVMAAEKRNTEKEAGGTTSDPTEHEQQSE